MFAWHPCGDVASVLVVRIYCIGCICVCCEAAVVGCVMCRVLVE